jgi:signal peptidase I
MAKQKSAGAKSGESLRGLLGALAIALLIRAFLVEPFTIPSGSMLGTLQVGDFVFVSKLSYRAEIPYNILRIRFPWGGTTLWEWDTPKRGDIVVFRYPGDQNIDYIKRVIAIPGDRVEVRNHQVLVNGALWPRQFTRSDVVRDQFCTDDKSQIYLEDNGERTYEVTIGGGPIDHANYGPVTVPEGKLFMMGDHRDQSADSRIWGFAPIEYVKGRALFIWLSIDPCKPLLQKIRWERLGQTVR